RLSGPPLAALEDAFFDYDRYDLEESARTSLDLDARILGVHGDSQVLIEGHCDERGSEKYNLALGDRRANAARHYLVVRGVAPDRVSTVSYGEERPFEQGQGEAAWAKNRRAHVRLAP
ncbi:MAG TPA: peptidoglycan-associated lipoprotein Pal, partial [Blastocatellia bacterium]|nr:peptidoglycan-associated lipoprotein Pal [Blastocatellia bacterium]